MSNSAVMGLVAIIKLLPTRPIQFYKSLCFRPWSAVVIFVQSAAAVQKSKQVSAFVPINVICFSICTISVSAYKSHIDICNCKLVLASLLLGPLVLSIVSLMSSLSVLQLYNQYTDIFCLKNERSFCSAKASNIFSTKILAYLRY